MAAIKGPSGTAWLDSLLGNPADILEHVVWIADNTLNASLFERCFLS